MRLTSFTDYSLRVLIYLATEPGRRATIAEIAQSFEISENHLVKVAHQLGRHGWLVNVRGKGGGLELAKSPDQISIGLVVRDTEGVAAPAECFEPDGRCCIARVCRLKGVMAEAMDAFFNVLDRYTLADLVRNHKTLAPILFRDPVRHPPGPADRPA